MHFREKYDVMGFRQEPDALADATAITTTWVAVAAAATTRMNDGHLRCPKEHRGAERRMGGAGIGSCGEPEANPLSR